MRGATENADDMIKLLTRQYNRARQSQITRQSAGITFCFCEAETIVGERVSPRSGSTSSPASGWTPRATPSASSAPTSRPTSSRRKAATSGSRRGSGRNSARRRISAAALTSALSAIPGIEACPLRPCTRRWNGELIFSAAEQR